MEGPACHTCLELADLRHAATRFASALIVGGKELLARSQLYFRFKDTSDVIDVEKKGTHHLEDIAIFFDIGEERASDE
jgi:hypothetical protein